MATLASETARDAARRRLLEDQLAPRIAELVKAIDRLEGVNSWCECGWRHSTRVLDVFRARDAYLATWLEDGS